MTPEPPTVDKVLAYGQSIGASPEETADAVQQWHNHALDWGADNSETPDDYLHGINALNADTAAALNGLKQNASQPDHPVFRLPPTPLAMPITDPAGNELATFQPRMRNDGGLSLLMAVPDQETNETHRAILNVPAVTQDDIGKEIRHAALEKVHNLRLADEAAENAHLSAGYDEGYGGDYGEARYRQRAMDAANRLAALSHPDTARGMLITERATDALHKSPLADQVGQSGIGPLTENFVREIKTLPVKLAATELDMEGDTGARDAARQKIADINATFPGDTRGAFKGGWSAVPGEVTTMAGQFAPAIAGGAVPGLSAVIMGLQSGSDANLRALDHADHLEAQARELRSGGEDEAAQQLEAQAQQVRQTRGTYATGTGLLMAAGGKLIPEAAPATNFFRAAATGGGRGMTEMAALMGLQGQVLDPTFLGESERMSAAETLKQAALGWILGAGHAAIGKRAPGRETNLASEAATADVSHDFPVSGGPRVPENPGDGSSPSAGTTSPGGERQPTVLPPRPTEAARLDAEKALAGGGKLSAEQRATLEQEQQWQGVARDLHPDDPALADEGVFNAWRDRNDNAVRDAAGVPQSFASADHAIEGAAVGGELVKRGRIAEAQGMLQAVTNSMRETDPEKILATDSPGLRQFRDQQRATELKRAQDAVAVEQAKVGAPDFSQSRLDAATQKLNAAERAGAKPGGGMTMEQAKQQAVRNAEHNTNVDMARRYLEDRLNQAKGAGSGAGPAMNGGAAALAANVPRGAVDAAGGGVVGSQQQGSPRAGSAAAGVAGSDPGGPGAAGASEFGVRRFSMRAAASPELRASWRAGITPQGAAYFKFHTSELRDRVKQKVGEMGLQKAFALFHSDPADSGLEPYERVALGGELMRQLDAEALKAETGGRRDQADEYNRALDDVFGGMEQLSTDHAQGLRAFGEVLRGEPGALLRKMDRDTTKVRAEKFVKDFPGGDAVSQGAADTANTERRKAREEAVQNVESGRWDALVTAMADMAQEAKRRGKEFMFKLTGRNLPDRSSYDRAEKHLANFRDVLEKDGAQRIAQAFFHEEQPAKRAEPGPLVQGSDAVRRDLASLLNEALDRVGVKRAEQTKPRVDEVQRLVTQLGLEDLKEGKLKLIDKIVRERVAEVLNQDGGEQGFTAEEEGARQDWASEILHRWEAVSSHMREATVSGATLRRIVHGLERERGSRFDDPAQAAESAKTIRDRVAAKSSSITKEGLDNIEKMTADTVRNLVRERQAARDRAAAKRGSAPPGYERQAVWMNNEWAKAFSDTPSLSSKPNLLRALVNGHLKEAMPDFMDRVLALGVRPDTAATLEKLVAEQRRRADTVARARAGEALVKRLQDAAKTPEAKSRVPAMVKTLLEGYETGVVSREDFLTAYAKAFKFPVLDPEARARLSKLRQQISQTPENSLQRAELMRQFMAEMEKAKGFQILNFASELWFSNKLCGLSTQVVAGAGNAAHVFMRSLAVAASSPREFPHFVKGLLEGFKQSIPEMGAALRGEAVRADVEHGAWTPGRYLELLYDPDGWKTLGGSAKNLVSLGRFTGRVIKAWHYLFFFHGAREAEIHRAAAEWSRDQVKAKGGDFKAYLANALHNTAADMKAALDQAAQENALMDAKMTDTALRRRAWEIVDQKRSDELRDAGSKFGRKMTHQQERETGTVGMVMDMADAVFNRLSVNIEGHGKLSPLKIMFSPFMHFVGNSLSNSLDFTPVGIARGLSGKFTKNVLMNWTRAALDVASGKHGAPLPDDFSPAEARERLASGIVGTLMGLSMAALAWGHKDDDDVNAPFMLYGDGPADPNRRAQMPPGWKPYSIKIGHTYVNYGETVLGPILGTLGQVIDAHRYKKGFQDQALTGKAVYALNAAVHLLTNHTAAQGLRDAVDMFNGERKMAPMLGRTLSGFIAPTGILADISRLFGESNVKPETLWGAMMKDIPFIRVAANKPARNVFGEPVSPEGLERLPVGRLVRDQGYIDEDFRFLGEHRLTVPKLRDTMVVLPPGLEGYHEAQSEFYSARASNLGAAYEKIWTPDEADRFVKLVGEGTRAAVREMRLDFKPTRDEALAKLGGGGYNTSHHAELQKELEARVRIVRKEAALTMAVQPVRSRL